MTRAILLLLLLATPLLGAPVRLAGEAEERVARLIEDGGGDVYRPYDGGPVTGAKAGARAFGQNEVDALKPCPALEWLDLRQAVVGDALDLSSLRKLRGVGVPTRCLAKGGRLVLGESVRDFHLDGQHDPLPGLKPLAERVEMLSFTDLGGLTPDLMALLPTMRRLHTLRLANSTFVPEGGVKQLARLTWLRDLGLHAMREDPTPAISAMTGLERLSIDGLDDLRFLKDLPHLRVLWLMDPLTNDAGLAQVAGLARLEELFLLRATKVTDAGLAHLAGLKSLRDLDMTGTPIRGDGLRHVVAAPLRRLTLYAGYGDAAVARIAGMTGLEELHLGEACVSARAMAGLRTLTRLRTLHVSLRHPKEDATPGDDVLSCVRGMASLEDLLLWDAKLGEAGLAHIGACGKLRKLELGRCGYTGAGLMHLAGCETLRELNLIQQPVEDRHLGPLGRLPALRSLSLYGCPVTGEGLPAMPTLRRLEMGATKLRDGDMARIVKSGGLTYLAVGGTAITDEGLKHAAKLAGLRELTLTGTKIGDAGLGRLAPLGRLRVLNLNDTPVSDEGLRHLRKMTHLREVWLNRTKVTSGGLAGLRRELPGAVAWKQE